MIRKVRRIGTTPSSHPFSSTAGRLRFEEMGYVEEEYFMYGTANIYSELDDYTSEIVYRDMPYCNRFLLRRPSNMTSFSGNIVVEILNSTAGFDIDRMWIAGASELMEIYSGDPEYMIDKFKLHNYKIVAAAKENAVSMYDVPLRYPLLLIIGGEMRGISKKLMPKTDITVRIDYGRDFPAALSSQSSAAILAFEVYRQNHR